MFFTISPLAGGTVTRGGSVEIEEEITGSAPAKVGGGEGGGRSSSGRGGGGRRAT